MYYRRKILLSLLQIFDGRLDKMSLEKLLFLVARQQQKSSFCFVPYKFGCFSFQANADLKTLCKYKLAEESENFWKKADDKDYMTELNQNDREALSFVKNHFGPLTGDDLIKSVYKNYPYYAINSIIAQDILSAEDLNAIKQQKPLKQDTVLFTIGYEGISLEQYLNKLILNDIKVLCDVRKNSLSMKYGFSKNQLKNACNGVGVEYIHIPELGIVSGKRQKLNTQADYDKLFAEYKSGVLNNEIKKQEEILQLLKSKNRIALTCFESNIHQCHRKHLAESLSGMNGFNYELKHL